MARPFYDEGHGGVCVCVFVWRGWLYYQEQKFSKIHLQGIKKHRWPDSKKTKQKENQKEAVAELPEMWAGGGEAFLESFSSVSLATNHASV